MSDKSIRCGKCGVILIDPRKKKIRSCSHYPLTIEKIDGNSGLMLGTLKSGDVRNVVCRNLDTCFQNIIDKLSL